MNASNLQGFHVYKGAISHTQVQALQSIFQRCLNFLGRQSFLSLIKDFVEKIPCESHNYSNYAFRFLTYIESLPVTEEYPYLPELAWLDWAWDKTYHTKEESSDPSVLMKLSEEDLSQYPLRLNPSILLGKFSHSIFALWRFCQYPESSLSYFKMERVSEVVCIYQRLGNVEIRKLTSELSDILLGVQNGKRLCDIKGTNKNTVAWSEALWVCIKSNWLIEDRGVQ